MTKQIGLGFLLAISFLAGVTAGSFGLAFCGRECREFTIEDALRLVGFEEDHVPTLDRKKFSGERLRLYLEANPRGVSKLLTHIFSGNHLTRQEREAIGQNLQMNLTAHPPREAGSQANGGLPRRKSA